MATVVQCALLVAFALVAGARAEEMGAVVALAGFVGVVALLIRGDVIALQLGRRLTYEMHPDRLEVVRAGKLLTTVRFDEVQEWTVARPATTFDFWIGRGRSHSWGPYVLDRYSFALRSPVGTTTVEPQVLFRWEDRGGLDDVTQALRERIGMPATNDLLGPAP